MILKGILNLLGITLMLFLLAVIGTSLQEESSEEKAFRKLVYWDRDSIAIYKEFETPQDCNVILKEGRNFALYVFHQYDSCDKIIADMKEEGNQPANLMELFVFLSQNSEPGEDLVIFALGSLSYNDKIGKQIVPYVDLARPGAIPLYWTEDIWPESCQFLAVENHK